MLDIVFAVIAIIAIIRGMRKGLIVALFSVVAFIVGLAAALKLSAAAAIYLKDHLTVTGKWLPVLSFALVFIVVVLAINWCAKLIEKTVEMALIGWVNKLAGAALFLILYTIVFSVFLFYAAKINLLQPETFEQSVMYPYVKPWGPVAIDNFAKIVPIFKDSFAELENFFEKMADKIH